MKRKSDNDLFINEDSDEENLFFLPSDSESDGDLDFSTSQDHVSGNENRIDSDEEEELTDVEWEEVSLNTEKETTDVVVVPLQLNTDDKQQTRKKNKAIGIEKRKLIYESKKLARHLNVMMIPFLLSNLVQRIKWTHDSRLNRRLKRSVPKLIQKKFNAFNGKHLQNKKQENELVTVLLGLVHWFRSHYKINSNGFRQHSQRLRYLVTSKKDAKYESVLNNPDSYYGSRPNLNLDDPLEDVRQMARNKMSNRDILTIFFAIILKNFLDANHYEISICFALPLISSIDTISTITKFSHLVKVPNRFDSDLLYPNFWIEVNHHGKIIVIDPLVHVKDEDIVSINNPGVPVKKFQPIDVPNQKFTFISRINLKTGYISDISPRYINNLAFRYFNYIPNYLPNPTSPNYKLYLWYMKCINRFNKINPITVNNWSLCSMLAFKNLKFPNSLKELIQSDNFIIPNKLKVYEIINPKVKPVCIWKFGQKQVPLYWKKDVIVLKSRQHWNILGRTVKNDSIPLKSKKYIPMNKKRQFTFKPEYEIRELFSLEQTVETPELPDYYINEYGTKEKIKDVFQYKNKFGHVEIYLDYMKPKGFSIVSFNDYPMKIKPLINKYNRNHKEKLNYLDVVSGFDFKDRPGFAIPIINSILFSDSDAEKAKELFGLEIEVESLLSWRTLLKKLEIRDRLNNTYDEHSD